MLQKNTHPTSLHKVCAHTQISGNEKVDKLEKKGNKLLHSLLLQDNEHAHTTPYSEMYGPLWIKGPIQQ
jgi:hypothetical protein